MYPLQEVEEDEQDNTPFNYERAQRVEGIYQKLPREDRRVWRYQARHAVRKGVERVLKSLSDTGHVEVVKDAETSANYKWCRNLRQ